MILKKEQIPNIGRIDSTSFLSDNEKEFVKAYFIREQEFNYKFSVTKASKRIFCY